MKTTFSKKFLPNGWSAALIFLFLFVVGAFTFCQANTYTWNALDGPGGCPLFDPLSWTPTMGYFIDLPPEGLVNSSDTLLFSNPDPAYAGAVAGNWSEVIGTTGQASWQINSIEYTAGAAPVVITMGAGATSNAQIGFMGTGLINNSGTTQIINFANDSMLQFFNSATIKDVTINRAHLRSCANTEGASWCSGVF